MDDLKKRVRLCHHSKRFMRVLIQRVSSASVTVDEKTTGKIGHGLLVFVGIEDADNDADIAWLSHKIVNLRLFDDANKVMNLSVKDVDGDILAVSQFTLHADTKKGNRPSYIRAGKPPIAFPLYEKFVERLGTDLNKKISTGVFGADMKVSLVNDGPVTIWMDSNQRD